MRSLRGATTSADYGAGLAPLRGGDRADYDAEAVKLFSRLNLDGGSAKGSAYNDADVVYRHPQSGACFFIGNQSIPSNKEDLIKKKIFKIVNCQEDGAKNAHEKDPHFEYMVPNFSISLWNYQPGTKTPEGLLQYMERLFRWVDARLDAGHNVMVHCLAGAHRAGTAGTAYVMYKAGLDAATALKAVKSCRPFVDPIYDFKDLLRLLDAALAAKGRGSRAAPAARGPPPAGARQQPLRDRAPAAAPRGR